MGQTDLLGMDKGVSPKVGFRYRFIDALFLKMGSVNGNYIHFVVQDSTDVFLNVFKICLEDCSNQ